MDFISEAAMRSLRGGSGGSGGGGGYSGGYSGGSSWGGGGSSTYGRGGGALFPYWFYTSQSSVNGGTEDDTIAVWVWIVLAVIVLANFGYCYHRAKKMTRQGGGAVVVDKDSEFDVAVSEARRNAMYSSPSSSSSCDIIYQTYGGTFDSRYSDRGKTLEAELRLRLTNDGSGGYTIEGEGSDVDGTTKVTDGYISYSGNAWWLEETLSGQDAGLKILSKGTFDFSNNSFSGTWRSSSKYQGKYVSFVGRDITKTLAGASEIPVVQAEADQDIPVAFATEEPVMSSSAPAYGQGK